MFKSVLEPYRYENQANLLASLEEKVIKPPKEKADEIEKELARIRNGN